MAAVDGWNDPSLKPPPICSYQWGELRPNDVQSAYGQLQHAKSVLTDSEQWNSEKFVISRLLFKLNNSLSIEKWYKGLKKVEKCMKRFKDMDLLKHTVYLTELWTSDFHSKATGKFFLPSRQMAEFWLVKVMGGAQLMRQIASYCVDVYTVMSRSLALHMCRWYDSLRGLTVNMKGSGVKWLPDDASNLPDNLEKWLEETSHEEHADIILKSPWVTVSHVDGILNSLQPASGSLQEEEDACEAVFSGTGLSGAASFVDDIGEPVEIVMRKPAERHSNFVAKTITPTVKRKTKKAKKSTPKRKPEKTSSQSSGKRTPQNRNAENVSNERTSKDVSPELQLYKTQKVKKKRKRTEDVDIPHKKKKLSNNRDAQKLDINEEVESSVENPTDKSVKRWFKRQKKEAKKKAELHQSNNQSMGTVGSQGGPFQKCPWTLMLQEDSALQARHELAQTEPKKKKKKKKKEKKQRQANIDSLVSMTQKTSKKQRILQKERDIKLKKSKLQKTRKKGRKAKKLKIP